MCARFNLFATPQQIAKLLDIDVPKFGPRYNIAPTQVLLGAVLREGGRQLREFRWGLIPSWAKDAKVGSKMINARSETLLEKPAFRNAFAKRRCVIPASGFFEWKHETIEEEIADDRIREASPTLFEEYDIPRSAKAKSRVVKQPYFFGLASREPFAFAGLYEYWRDGAGELIRSCTILTTRPNSLIEPLHDRMPVILRPPHLDRWIDCESNISASVQDLFEPFPANEMMGIEVSTSVNDPNNDSPGLMPST